VAFCDALVLLEQDGLADSAQSGDAQVTPLLGVVLDQPLKSVDLLPATRQIRRSCAYSGA